MVVNCEFSVCFLQGHLARPLWHQNCWIMSLIKWRMGMKSKTTWGAESSEQNDNPAGNENKGKYTGVK